TPGDEKDVVQAPWNPGRSKGSVYEGGVNVPLLISGPLVAQPGSECAALVSVVDILPTIAEIAGIKLDSVVVQEGPAQGRPIHFDGHSLLPYLRDPTAAPVTDRVFAEQFYPNGEQEHLEYRDRMLRSQDWKLMQTEEWDAEQRIFRTDHFFRMEPGAWDEGPDLLDAVGGLGEEEAAAYADLRWELTALEAQLSYGPPAEH
ncbi:MAG TPA: hypothetical protein PLA94_31560, partial [Myxococcota bacterium]|nr:hypothetical protein [Myxococcota bacterium]